MPVGLEQLGGRGCRCGPRTRSRSGSGRARPPCTTRAARRRRARSRLRHAGRVPRRAGPGARARAPSGGRSARAQSATRAPSRSRPAGRTTSRFGHGAQRASCSIGWCVGPSSPRPIESCVKTKIDGMLHQRREPDRRPHVVARRSGTSRRSARKPVQREAVDDRAHAVLADAEVQVAPAELARASTLPPSSISVSVDGARSAEPPTSSGTCAAAHWITLLDALRVAIVPVGRVEPRHVGVPAVGELAPRASARARRRSSRCARRPRVEALLPLGLGVAPAVDCAAEVREHLVGDVEGLLGSASRRPPSSA